MITQTIKRWLDKLFAWWPWKQSSPTSYARPVSNLNTGLAQETIWHTLPEGPFPQLGIMSIAVEQEKDEGIYHTNRPEPDELPESYGQPVSPVTTEHSNPAQQPPAQTTEQKETHPSPTPEQHFAFLLYLVEHGHINEGFADGQVPEQYRKLHRPPSS
ncbi:hypothetical protein EPA93_27930 [Ktedonosporobacter rubrisoli]|uniref:Uncharacterized protein n=1 Tax=Ktedonosporobacter rubrisoli TaxID=2509675 RepID=A0A4P6JVA6_KTERU|nr:hypothetical protein [Ktedonosporobacter rubrisoli]QBD79599.1 hypothetical protein EPA93_27930 [Ktedonosporobacter rubrisoli]